MLFAFGGQLRAFTSKFSMGIPWCRRELSNAVSHSSMRRREEVDSWLLVVGSQTASLTPGPSFAHNLGCRCPNGKCEAIFDIYVSRPFQWHQEHPNERCFRPCYRALNIRESQRTPNLQLFQVLGFTPTLGQSGVATLSPTRRKRSMSSLTLRLSFIQLQLLSSGSLAICRLFAAWALSQANLGIPRTLSWQVQEGLVENPLPMLRQKTKLA
jgi:hypothetical protein